MSKTQTKKTREKPRQVNVELPFGNDPFEIHCPACGKSATPANDRKKPCEHVLLTYSDMASMCMYVAPRLQDTIEDDIDLDKALKQIAAPSVLVLSVTSGGMACGPVWETTTVAFDLQEPQESAEKN